MKKIAEDPRVKADPLFAAINNIEEMLWIVRNRSRTDMSRYGRAVEMIAIELINVVEGMRCGACELLIDKREGET
jgi:hypothetical protein